MKTILLICLLISVSIKGAALKNFSETVTKLKPSIVGVGDFSIHRVPQRSLLGTGFVVADGHHVITNAHVVANAVNDDKTMLSVFVGTENKLKIYSARIIAQSERTDLAVLRFDGPALPALLLDQRNNVKEGEFYAFTGFPIGQVMGQYPVTHHSLIAAITPHMIPVKQSADLTPAMIKKLRDPIWVYQLDATAYPGNSGSPLYNPSNGQVIGVINKVFIAQSKEQVLSHPSGISFAIPVRYVKELLREARIK